MKSALAAIPTEQARTYMRQLLPKLDYWKNRINLEYQLPNGSKVKFLDDSATYLGNQLESTLESGRCFGIAANADFLLVCTYGENGVDPELVVYKKR